MQLYAPRKALATALLLAAGLAAQAQQVSLSGSLGQKALLVIDGKPHGPQEADHHAGDLPSLKADDKGNAELRVSLKGLAIGSGAADIVGKGLIVHAQPDDYKTQPTGNAGARFGCGVVQ